MAAIGEKEIKALIRSGDIGGAFLLFGTESYLKEFYSSKLKDKAVSPDFADFNYHFFDGASCTLEDIEQAVEAFPMMSSNTCVFVKDMAVDSLDEDSYEKLEKIVGDVPDYCTLIFYIGKADSLKKTAKAKRQSRSLQNTVMQSSSTKRPLMSLQKCLSARRRSAILCSASETPNILSLASGTIWLLF